MNIKRTWIVAGATIAVAGFAGAGIAMASDDVDLRDQQPVPVVELKSDDRAPAKQAAADSGASARSADSASDSPGEPGYKPAAPPAKPKPAPAKPAPAKVAPAKQAPVAGSADSPAPKKVYRPAPVYSGDSGASGASGGSADSGD
jgi:hypothetical protein